MKNEQKYGDVLDILDTYEESLHLSSRKAGVDVTNIKVQLGDDQLTHDRFCGAKSLRVHLYLPCD